MEEEIDYNKVVDNLIDSFWQIEHLKSFSERDIARVKQAYAFAKEAHKKQQRKSGEPYIIHPIAVSRIVAEEFMLGPNTIIAAFLHDVVEDTDYTIEDIKSIFGEDVAVLVNSVTKEKKEHYEMSKQLDNYKHMLYSINYDIRSLLIKLADRLHNMRTLNSMRSDKQMKIAGETDYFYAPLANRLGLYLVKSELENLSMQYRCPQEYTKLGKQLKEYIASREEGLNLWTTMLKEHILKYGIKVDIEVKFRSIYSIWRKMQISASDFKHIKSKYVIQITVDELDGKSEKNRCLEIYSAITDICKELPGTIRNYIDSPKENGYQAIHFKVLDQLGEWSDLHISSRRMINSSKMGCISERTIKGNDWIGKFKNVLKDMSEESKTGGFMDNIVSNFYNDDILVFTPNGNGVVLPKSSSALDFAYEIHSNIGNHAQYAKINGKLMAVKTRLRRGDCIEIGTSDSVTPKREWLDHIKTYKARKHILIQLRRTEDNTNSNYIRCPKCNPLPGDEVIGFTAGQEMIKLHKRNCAEAVREASQAGDNIVDVEFNISRQIYPAKINIKAVDRYRLLIDLVSVITLRLKLCIDSLTTVTKDEIVDCNICFGIHSISELLDVMVEIDKVQGVDEVKRVLDE